MQQEPKVFRVGDDRDEGLDWVDFFEAGADLGGVIGIEEATQGADQIEFLEKLAGGSQGDGTAGKPAGVGAGGQVAVAGKYPGLNAVTVRKTSWQIGLERCQGGEIGAEVVRRLAWRRHRWIE